MKTADAPHRTAYYAYDAAGNRTRVTSPHGESTYFAYDPAGSLVCKRLETGAQTYYTYDAAGRVETLRNALASGAPTCYFTYDYDAASRVASISREDGTVVYYAYDAADRLLEEQWKQGASSVYAFAWDYDAVGNRTRASRATPAS